MKNYLVLALLLFVVSAESARAAFVPAADLVGNVQGALGLPANSTVGFSFTIGSLPTTVNTLALDSGTGFVATPMSVHIWQAGTSVDVAQANISSANSLSLDGRYFYMAIAPVTLLANTTYDIGVDLPFFNQGAMFGGTPIHDPRIASINGAITGPAGSFPTADNNHVGAGPLFGPTFAIGVPEPSSLALAAFGFAGLAAWGWRRKLVA